MDFVLCQEILKQAEHLGANDAAVIVENIIQRTEIRNNGKRILHTDKFIRANLHIHVGNGTYQANLIQANTGIMERQSLLEWLKNGIQAAKLSNIWGCLNKPKPLREVLGQTSAQICPPPAKKEPEIIGWDEDANPIYKVEKPFKCPELDKPNACIPECFQPACLQMDDIDAPMLNKIESEILGITSAPNFKLTQTVSYVDTMVYLLNEVKSQTRYETLIKQTLELNEGHNTQYIHLPDYWFDGLIHDPNTQEHEELLKISEIWQDLNTSSQATASPDNLKHGIILSPWVLGILAHEANHLGINIATSGKMQINMSKCLYLPPRPINPCKGIALEHIGHARPTKRLLFARVPSHTLIVDVPSAWVRRNTFELDIQCMVACELSEQSVTRYFKPVILRFDLKNMWQYCSEIAEPSRRIALNCCDGIGVFQTPWAYFNMKNIYRDSLL